MYCFRSERHKNINYHGPRLLNKESGSIGLGLADLSASPIARDVLDPEQGNREFDPVKSKTRTEITIKTKNRAHEFREP